MRAADHRTFREQLSTLLGQVPEGDAEARPAPATTTEPAMIAEAFGRLLKVMARVEEDHDSVSRAPRASQPTARLLEDDVTELGEYAFRLIEELSRRFAHPAMEEQKRQTDDLTIGFALWIARHGGHIETLEPVVDAIARVANTTHDPGALEQLSETIGTIITAVSAVIQKDLDKFNPGRPWRVILLNQGIVATRSHNPAIMERAFSELVQHLPEDAASFFTQGMEQMDALNYPARVREVMERYYRQWSVNRSLH
jgi:hypothetical protein